MNLFSRKKKELVLNAIANGTILPLEQVADAVFSTKMMGDGYAINPTDGQIYAPVAGTISSIFPTKHALGITTDEGVELLLHLGLDTVELAGAPFTIHVEEGDTVTTDQLLVAIDLPVLTAANKAATCMVIITNMDHVKKLSTPVAADVSHGTAIQTITL